MATLNKKTLFTVILIAVSLFVSVILLISGSLDNFELKAYDQFSRRLNPLEPEQDIVVIEVDQQSLDALSDQGIHFPWPRQVYAPIIEYLSEADAVFIDIIFSEPSSSGVEDDQILAEAIRKSSKVYLPVYLTLEKKPMSKTDREFLKKHSIREKLKPYSTYASAVTPIDLLKGSVEGTGNVMIQPDKDGVYRNVPLAFRLENLIIPNFILHYLLKNNAVHIKDGNFYADDIKVPLRNNELYLRFFREGDPFPGIPALEILNSYLARAEGKDPSLKKEFFRDKKVFIGYTAAGLKDLKATSVSSTTSGVYVHATALENLMNRNFIRPISTFYTIILMVIICISVSYFVLRHPSMIHNVTFFTLAILLVSGIEAGLFKNGVYMNIIAPLTSLLISFIVAAAYSYATEGKERQFIKNTFSQYMDSKIVNYILDNPALIRPGGQRKKVTVFFTDIAGFTTMAEKLPPEQTARILHTTLNACTEVIIRNGGVIDKYIGDAIMAFWGAPVLTGNDELNACRAALQCCISLDGINEAFRKEGLNEINMRIGLHSGEAIVGNLGSDRIFDYTAIGDTVNLASRLEGVNKVFGTRIIASDDTLKNIDDPFLTRELGLIEVKGKDLPARIFELISEQETTAPRQKEISSRFHNGLEHFRSKKWDDAIAVFDDILKAVHNDGPSLYYKKWCESLSGKTELTDGWDIIKMTVK